MRRSRVLGSEALTAFFVHGFDFVAAGVNLDLHWSLSRHPSFRVDEARIWECKGEFLLNDRSYGVLSDEDEVTLEVLALLRDIARGRPKIKNVADLIQVVATIDPTMAWDALFASGRRNGTYGPLEQWFRFASTSPMPTTSRRAWRPPSHAIPAVACVPLLAECRCVLCMYGVRNQALGCSIARHYAWESLVCVVGRVAAVSPCRAWLAAARRWTAHSDIKIVNTSPRNPFGTTEPCAR